MFPWIYSKLLTKASALYPGTEPAVIEFKEKLVGITICYEDILPSFSYENLAEKTQFVSQSHQRWMVWKNQ